MSALAYAQDPRSPVTRWLHATFPYHQQLQSSHRIAAGPARMLPLDPQGADIDT